MEPVKINESKHSDEADLKIYKSELNMLNKIKPTGEKQLKRKAELEKKIADLEKSMNEIGMFHDPRTSSSFKNDADKWENGALHVRIQMLKNKGITADEAKELATTHENKPWEEVKKLLNLNEIDINNMPTGAMMIQMADNNPEQFKKYIKMMKNDPGFRVMFMKKLKDSERKEFADKLKTLKEGLPKGYWAKNIPGGKDDMNEDYKTLVKKIKGQGKSEKAAKAIAGAVASAKLKGAGKGPTTKQTARSK